MRKKIAKHIKSISDNLPTVYTESEEMIEMSGYWLNRSGYGEVRKFNEKMLYAVPVPVFKAVGHRHQLKDAFKRDQIIGVKDYIRSL